ncbi:MAG TPA: hypothetical protein VGF55_12025 [Gemmataceae bacterium]|jgi:hypothetical protein
MPDPTPPAEPTREQLKAAMKAFKRRLKLTRLDAESQLSKNPLSTGRGSGIVAIVPPVDFPQAVWDELVRQNKLKKAGHGLYELVAE